MPEHVKPSAQPPSHAHTLRADALRLLSRSPKPYHRQQFELSHAAESLSKAQSSAPSRHHTDDEDSRSARPPAGSYHESTNSESGTEADDEHFLKGLPAPRLRLHKGLRGADVPYSNTPSPQLSPTLVSVEVPRISGAAVFRPSASANAIRQSQERTTRKRRNIEILRRTIELGLLWGVAGILCLKQEVWRLLIFWGKGGYFCRLTSYANTNDLRTRMSDSRYRFFACNISPAASAVQAKTMEICRSIHDTGLVRPSSSILSSCNNDARCIFAFCREAHCSFAEYDPVIIHSPKAAHTSYRRCGGSQRCPLVSGNHALIRC